MQPTRTEQRLRNFCLGLAGWMCAVTPLELILAEHYKSATQLIPFVLCALGLLAALGALFRPARATLLGLRWVMAVTLIGSLVGVIEHFSGNAEFAREIQPNAAATAVWLAALRGAAPLLAPGILAVAALLGLAGTYAHPALAAAQPQASALSAD